MSSGYWMVALFGTSTFWQMYSRAMQYVNRWDRQQWFMVLCGVLIAGALCLRGFGSAR